MPEPAPVFIKLGKLSKWTYMGHYEFKSWESLTKEEFAALDRQAIITICCDHLQREWAKPLLAHLHFRKQNGRDGTEEELSEVMAGMTKRDSSGAYLGISVNASDIEEVLRQGEDTLDTAVINCVRYEEAFQKIIIERSKMNNDELRSFNNRMIETAGGRPLPAPKTSKKRTRPNLKTTTRRKSKSPNEYYAKKGRKQAKIWREEDSYDEETDAQLESDLDSSGSWSFPPPTKRRRKSLEV